LFLEKKVFSPCKKKSLKTLIKNLGYFPFKNRPLRLLFDYYFYLLFFFSFKHIKRLSEKEEVKILPLPFIQSLP